MCYEVNRNHERCEQCIDDICLGRRVFSIHSLLYMVSAFRPVKPLTDTEEIGLRRAEASLSILMLDITDGTTGTSEHPRFYPRCYNLLWLFLASSVAS